VPETNHSEVFRPDFVMSVLGWGLFTFSLFPYLLILPIPTDTQPYALIFATFIFLIGHRDALPLPIWTLFVVLVAASLIFVVTGATFNGVRSLAGYASVFFISASVLILAFRGVRLTDRMLKFAVVIWFVVGAIQLFLAPGFLSSILARSSTTETRGVTSLAVEPAAYATMMLFTIMIFFLRGRERTWPVFLCLIQIVVFSQSALGILFAALVVGLYALVRFSAPAAIVTLAFLAIISFFIFINAEEILGGTRFGGLLNLLATRPEALFALDESVAARVSNIIYSIKGAFESWLTPHGFDAWSSYSDRQEQIYLDVFVRRGISSDRIMSGYGAVLFELGALGFAIPIILTIGVIKNAGNQNIGRAAALLLMIHALMLMPVPLSLPMVGILIGELFVKASLPLHAIPSVSRALTQHSIRFQTNGKDQPKEAL
jgi:hypothetical protein